MTRKFTLAVEKHDTGWSVIGEEWAGNVTEVSYFEFPLGLNGWLNAGRAQLQVKEFSEWVCQRISELEEKTHDQLT